ncbi:MAG: dihydroorotase [Candidatus Omnitrophica bacterium]|nr:dihydroorotase [Candidatus Omnitrophota bacterium]
MDILIKNIRIIDPAQNIDKISDVYISNTKIILVDKKINKKPPMVIDGTDYWMFPGLTDLHCHLREPGREDEETLLSGSRAAAKGGFTRICCQPNTEPPVDNKIAVRYIYDRASLCPVEILPYGAITAGRKGLSLAPMGEMISAGAIGFSDDGNCVMDSLVFRRALEYSRIFEKVVISHSEDTNLSKSGVMNEGFISTKLGVQGIPAETENIMVYRDIQLAKLTKAKLHLAHLSTEESVKIVREAKKTIKNLSCEVTVHHLVLTEEALINYRTNAKVNPPLRKQADIEALIEGLKDGTIDAIVTDHAPHSSEEKDDGLENAPFGMLGFETALPMVFSLTKYGLKPVQLLEKLIVNPNKIIGYPVPEIKEGMEADFVIYDPSKEWLYKKKDILSKSKNSPFIGWKLKGKVLWTFCKGKIVYECR